MKTWTRAGVVWCVLAAACLGALRAAAQDPIAADKPSADFLPEETLVLIEVRDISATGRRLEQTALYKVFAEPGVKAYLAPITQQVAPMLGMVDMQLQQQFKLTLNDLGRLFNGRVAIALTGLNVAGEAQPVKAALLLAPKDPAHLAATLQNVLTALPPQVAQNLVKRQFEGADVSEFPDPNMPLSWTTYRGALVFGLGGTALDEVLTRMAGRPARRLSGEPSYQATMKRVADANQDWLLYASLERPIRLWRAVASAQVGRVLDYLGLEQIRGLAVAGKVSGEAVEDVLYLYAPGPAGRLVALLKPKPVEMSLLKNVPRNADSVFLGRLDVGLLYDSIMDGMKQLMEPGDYQEVMEQYAKAEQEVGLSFADDLLRTLGDQFVGYTVPLQVAAPAADAAPQDPEAMMKAMVEAGYGRIALMLTVKDAAKLRNGLAKLTDFALAKIKEDEAGDPKVADLKLSDATYAGVSIRTLEGIPDVALTPSYAVTDNMLVFAGRLETLKAALDQMQGGAGDVTQGDLYAKALPHIPQGAGMVSFSDPLSGMDQQFDAMKNMFRTMGMMMPQIAAIAEQDPKPVKEALRKHMFVPVFAVVADEEGVALRSYSPYGGATMVPVAALGAGAMGAMMFRMRMMMRGAMGPGMPPVMPMPE